MIFHGNSLHCKGPISEAKFLGRTYGRSQIECPPRDIIKNIGSAQVSWTDFSLLLTLNNNLQYLNMVMRTRS